MESSSLRASTGVHPHVSLESLKRVCFKEHVDFGVCTQVIIRFSVASRGLYGDGAVENSRLKMLLGGGRRAKGQRWVGANRQLIVMSLSKRTKKKKKRKTSPRQERMELNTWTHTPSRVAEGIDFPCLPCRRKGRRGRRRRTTPLREHHIIGIIRRWYPRLDSTPLFLL